MIRPLCCADARRGHAVRPDAADRHHRRRTPYLLNRINYLTDPAYDGRFDPNPMHREVVAA
ncbi:MAG: hypothetical protein J2P47_03230 [Acetobacteraceae bacterium]|nr:hypothetical protein [Acetobacteraceae bacterium]